jgi:hypothetical protein
MRGADIGMNIAWEAYDDCKQVHLTLFPLLSQTRRFSGPSSKLQYVFVKMAV